ncbi:ABC transporter ATP-binding protein [Muricomes intestini]|uniref:ABC transporter ATP-binding protein n=1 Tax=Muricomes intestini TaxID=1796634 RepID=UPI002FE3854D
MIELQNVCKYYGNKLALDNVSFSIYKASVIGLLGKNGAGKSTLMNIMTGYLPATVGDVVVDGRSMGDAPQEVKSKVGYLPEKPPVYDTMSVYEFLCYVARLKGVPSRSVSSEVNNIIERTALGDVTKRLIRNLSKGYQQRVGIAQAMIGEPKILILDEPTVGLDPSQVVEIQSLLMEYAKKHVIIVSSHILTEISEICDRILILNEGKLIKDCRVSELSNSNKKHIFIRVDAERMRFENIIQKSLANCRYDYKGAGEPGCSDWELIVESCEEDIRKRISRIVMENKLNLLQMFPVNTEIEDAFFDLTAVGHIK